MNPTALFRKKTSAEMARGDKEILQKCKPMPDEQQIKNSMQIYKPFA